MAQPWNTHQDPTPNLILHRRYYAYDEGPRRTVVYLVEEFYFDDDRLFYIKTLRAYVDLD